MFKSGWMGGIDEFEHDGTGEKIEADAGEQIEWSDRFDRRVGLIDWWSSLTGAAD